MHEDHRERLRVLADSINESARMARATLSLYLFVALYLALTLLSSSDENMLRNGQVELPQFAAGITILQSYVVGPLVFLYLHGQALLLLTVIARKVSTFEAALEEVIPYTAENVHARRKECRDWLSAFALIQALQRDPGASNLARVLSWLATDAVPLALLFAIDLSFVRYQSSTVTLSHHIIFFLDLLLVVWFNQRAFDQGEARTPARIGIWTRRLLASGMMLMLFSAYPPNGTEDRHQIWRDGTSYTISNLLDAGPCRWWAVACRYLDVSNFGNLTTTPDADDLRASLPRIERLGRSPQHHGVKLRLVGRKLRFAKFRSARLPGIDFREAELQGADFREARLQETILRDAMLQGADLQDAALQGADLRGAGLQRANLFSANLQKADLRGAHMQRASMEFAKLQGADLSGAELRRARLEHSELQGAVLRDARLHSANLEFAKLQSATFVNARLQGVHLRSAEMQDAYLRGAVLQGAYLGSAQLQGAILPSANLQGAILRDAQLQGADLSGALLHGADLLRARLDGVNLRKARLQCTIGIPSSWYLAWMPEFESEFPAVRGRRNGGSLDERTQQYFDELITDEMATIAIAWKDRVSLKELLTRQLTDCPSQPFSGDQPSQIDAVFHTREDWPHRAEINTDGYLDAWIDWTIEFACTNVHAARSSMWRWNADALDFNDKISSSAKGTVRSALVAARERGKRCPGLSAISDEEWADLLESDGYV